jgi:hypothetical protein
LRQEYSKSIAVLTPYVKQLKIIQKFLSERAVKVVLDDRDVSDLDKLDEEEDLALPSPHSQVELINVSEEVICQTIDNFQGKEDIFTEAESFTVIF